MSATRLRTIGAGQGPCRTPRRTEHASSGASLLGSPEPQTPGPQAMFDQPAAHRLHVGLVRREPRDVVPVPQGQLHRRHLERARHAVRFRCDGGQVGVVPDDNCPQPLGSRRSRRRSRRARLGGPVRPPSDSRSSATRGGPRHGAADGQAGRDRAQLRCRVCGSCPSGCPSSRVESNCPVRRGSQTPEINSIGVLAGMSSGRLNRARQRRRARELPRQRSRRGGIGVVRDCRFRVCSQGRRH